MKKLRRNLDTAENRRYWRLAQRRMRQRRSWPEWRKAGVTWPPAPDPHWEEDYRP